MVGNLHIIKKNDIKIVINFKLKKISNFPFFLLKKKTPMLINKIRNIKKFSNQ